MDTDQRIAALEARITKLEDEDAVRKLQYLYGYLIDQCMYNEVVDLFSDDGEVHFFGGKFIGKESVRRLYVGRFRKTFTFDFNGPEGCAWIRATAMGVRTYALMRVRGSPAVIGTRPLDRWLCVPVFRRVCPYHCT